MSASSYTAKPPNHLLALLLVWVYYYASSRSNYGRPAAAAAAAVPISSSSSSSSSNCSRTVEITQGPYWVEEDIQDSDVRGGLVYGVPLLLFFQVHNLTSSSSSATNADDDIDHDDSSSCVAMENVRIDLWHARYDGLYSDVEVDFTGGQTWLRGYQYTNASGIASFTTIYPGT